MAFIRQKGKAFYLVESRREGGKVRHHTICYLGRHGTLEAALAHWQRMRKCYQEQIEPCQSIPVLRLDAEAKARQAQEKIDRLQGIIESRTGRAGHYTPAEAAGIPNTESRVGLNGC